MRLLALSLNFSAICVSLRLNRYDQYVDPENYGTESWAEGFVALNYINIDQWLEYVQDQYELLMRVLKSDSWFRH
jgi:hypothetical protein